MKLFNGSWELACHAAVADNTTADSAVIAGHGTTVTEVTVPHTGERRPDTHTSDTLAACLGGAGRGGVSESPGRPGAEPLSADRTGRAAAKTRVVTSPGR